MPAEEAALVAAAAAEGRVTQETQAWVVHCCWNLCDHLADRTLGDEASSWSLQGMPCLPLASPLTSLHSLTTSSQTHPPPHTIPPNPSTIPAPSRSYRQHETSASISGTYDLFDVLDLSTTSGSISVTIIPQPGTQPAVLNLATTSGSIDVRFAPAGLHTPDRLYQSTISTQSGSISGRIVINGVGSGASASISTRSGSSRVTLYPVLSSRYSGTAMLNTSSNSGSQIITIESPPSHQVLSGLAATHMSYGSGSLTIRYPAEWKGIVHAKSGGSGGVNVKGDSLQYQLKGSREVYAWRGMAGEEVETVDINGIGSGSIKFSC
jgi:hypothetical protein